MYSEDYVDFGKATRGIPLFDIELPAFNALYDDGIRGGTDSRPYKPEIVGTGSADRPFFRYIGNVESPNQDRYGKLINGAPYTFYQLLERYYAERENT